MLQTSSLHMKRYMNRKSSSVNGAHYELVLFFNFYGDWKFSTSTFDSEWYVKY